MKKLFLSALFLLIPRLCFALTFSGLPSSGQLNLQSYTITDANTCGPGTVISSGGGSITCQLFWNGANWIAMSMVPGGGALGTNGTQVANALTYWIDTATLGSLSVCATGTLVYGQTGAPPICSTTTWPNAVTKGDILTATTGSNVGRITAVPIGSVLTSQNAGTIDIYQALYKEIVFPIAAVAATTTTQWGEVKLPEASKEISATLSVGAFTCSVNPSFSLFDCSSTAGTCTPVSTMATSGTISAIGVTAMTLSTTTAASGEFLAVEFTAGTCTALNASVGMIVQLNQ